MIYVSEETKKDNRNRRQRKGPAAHIIVLRDTCRQDFRLESPWRDLPSNMKAASIKLQDVCGLAKSGYQTVFVTPVTGVELAVLRCMTDPRITTRPRRYSEMCDSFLYYGWWNIAVSGGSCSVARLLLEKSPEEANTIGGSIECGRDIVHICADERFGVLKYVTYDLCDFQAFHRIRNKKKILRVSLQYHTSFPIEWKEYSEGVVHPRCRVIQL